MVSVWHSDALTSLRKKLLLFCNSCHVQTMALEDTVVGVVIIAATTMLFGIGGRFGFIYYNGDVEKVCNRWHPFFDAMPNPLSRYPLKHAKDVRVTVKNFQMKIVMLFSTSIMGT